MTARQSYYTDEEVVGSAYKYHRTSCPSIQRINRLNHKLFPSPQSAEEHGLVPCGVCKPFSSQAGRQTLDPTVPPLQPDEPLVSASQLADWRRAIVQLLNVIQKTHDEPQGGGVAARIRRLSQSGVIPSELAPFMLGITQMRNAAEYEGKRLTEKESAAVIAAWEMLQEWAGKNGFALTE